MEKQKYNKRNISLNRVIFESKIKNCVDEKKVKFLCLEINFLTPKKYFYIKTKPKKRVSHVKLNFNIPYKQTKNDFLIK